MPDVVVSKAGDSEEVSLPMAVIQVSVPVRTRVWFGGWPLSPEREDYLRTQIAHR